MLKKHILIGLTGGIGSGKTTVARIFKSVGAKAVIDADRIGHALLNNNLVKKNSSVILVKES